MIKQVIGAIIEVVLMVLLAAVISCLMALGRTAPVPQARVRDTGPFSPGWYSCQWANARYRFEFFKDGRYVAYQKPTYPEEGYVSTSTTEVWIPKYNGVWKWHRGLLTMSEREYTIKTSYSTYYLGLEFDSTHKVWRGSGKVEGLKPESPPFLVTMSPDSSQW